MRRPLGYLAAALLGGATVTLLGAGPQQPKPAAPKPGLLEATRLVLRSPDGSARMILSGGTDDGGPSIQMLGPDVEARMTLGLGGKAGDPAIELKGFDGSRIVLGVEQEAGHVVLGMKDGAGKERLRAYISPKDGPRFEVVSPDGRVLYRAPNRGEGRDG